MFLPLSCVFVHNVSQISQNIDDKIKLSNAILSFFLSNS